jgi:hypothetical protein
VACASADSLGTDVVGHHGLVLRIGGSGKLGQCARRLVAVCPPRTLKRFVGITLALQLCNRDGVCIRQRKGVSREFRPRREIDLAQRRNEVAKARCRK